MKIYEYVIQIKDQATDKLRNLRNMANSTMGGLRSFGGQLKSLGGDIANVFGLGMLSRFAPTAVVAGLGLLGKQAVTLAADLEKTKVGFEVMLGSAEKANKMVGDLRTMAKVTPFETRDLVAATETMLGFGIAGEKILPTLKMLVDSSRGNSERLRSITLAFSQIHGAGRLTGDNLRQLINAGFNPLQIISQKTGKSLATLNEEMEAGKISSGMVAEAFEIATSKGGLFYQMTERISKTFEGMASTLREEWNEALTDIGEFILPKAIEGLRAVSSILSDLRTRVDMEPLINSFRVAGEALNELRSLLDDLLGMFGFASSQVGTLQSIFNHLSFALLNATLPLRLFVEQFRIFIEFIRSSFNILVGFGKILFGLYTFDIKTLKDGAKQLWEDGFINPIERTKDRLVDLFDTYKNGYKKIFTTGPKPDQQSLADLGLSPGGGGGWAKQFGGSESGSAGSGSNSGSKAAKKTVDTITGGGRQAVNVTINLDNLIGVQNFDVTNMKESLREMEKGVVEALLRVLNSANYAASQ